MQGRDEPGRTTARKRVDDGSCSMECLQVLGERWTLLVLREVFAGRHRFSDIQSSLGIASNLLSTRLSTLVEMKVLRTETYRVPGQRPRQSYHLTQSGQDLHIVLAALQEWSNVHLPDSSGPYFTNRSRASDEDVHVAFVGPDGREIPAEDVAFHASPGAGEPTDFPAADALVNQ